MNLYDLCAHAADHILPSTAVGSFDLVRNATAVSPSMKPLRKGSRLSKNLSELALSAGVTSQFQPSGIGRLARIGLYGVDCGRLNDAVDTLALRPQ